MNRNKPGIIKRILNALERFIARIRGKDAYLAVEQRQAAERLRDMLTGELKRAYGTDVKGEAAAESDGGKKYSLAGANSRTADLNSLGGAYHRIERHGLGQPRPFLPEYKAHMLHPVRPARPRSDLFRLKIVYAHVYFMYHSVFLSYILDFCLPLCYNESKRR